MYFGGQIRHFFSAILSHFEKNVTNKQRCHAKVTLRVDQKKLKMSLAKTGAKYEFRFAKNRLFFILFWFYPFLFYLLFQGSIVTCLAVFKNMSEKLKSNFIDQSYLNLSLRLNIRMVKWIDGTLNYYHKIL